MHTEASETPICLHPQAKNSVQMKQKKKDRRTDTKKVIRSQDEIYTRISSHACLCTKIWTVYIRINSKNYSKMQFTLLFILYKPKDEQYIRLEMQCRSWMEEVLG